MNGKIPRIFLAKWDNSKCVNLRDQELRFGKKEHFGTLYPNGKVSLELGFGWDSWAEMQSHFACSGNLEVVFLDEEAQHAQTA